MKSHTMFYIFVFATKRSVWINPSNPRFALTDHSCKKLIPYIMREKLFEKQTKCS